MMHILIAPNAFKNSLTAHEAANAIEAGLRQSNLNFTCSLFPIADGGDGTGSLLIEKCEGIFVRAMVHDPLGRKIQSSFGLIDYGKTAVIEMADASGIRLLKAAELNPLKATSFGTGELIKLALDAGARKIILAMGGSATVDGGSGILQALGIRFLNAKHETLSRPEDLIDLAAIDFSRLDKRIANCEIVILCDVDNKLSGNEGAARVFGPQKGARTEDVIRLEAVLSKVAEVVFAHTGKDMNAVRHGGTAGGAAAGLYALLNAKLVKGAEYFLELTGFNQVLEKADLIITAEGSIDEQTLQGKGPFAVALKAKFKKIPVIGLAGKVPGERSLKLQEYFDVLLPIGNQPTDMGAAIKSTADNLVRTSTEIGNLLALTHTVNNDLQG